MRHVYTSLVTKQFSPFYLVVIKLAVLEVGRGGDGTNAGVRVVEGVLTHTVRETYGDPRTQQGAGGIRHIRPLPFILHQEVCSPRSAVHRSLLTQKIHTPVKHGSLLTQRIHTTATMSGLRCARLLGSVLLGYYDILKLETLVYGK